MNNPQEVNIKKLTKTILGTNTFAYLQVIQNTYKK